jgi:sugar phosphate isomerase/epimerase
MPGWLNVMERFLGQLHLHDNMGEADEHLAIGKGVIDFEFLFGFLSRKGLSPIITLEAHRPEDVILSLDALKGLLERYPI